jgi:hypothetical protein
MPQLPGKTCILFTITHSLIKSQFVPPKGPFVPQQGALVPKFVFLGRLEEVCGINSFFNLFKTKIYEEKANDQCKTDIGKDDGGEAAEKSN